jgi:hypothetical protein
LQLLPVALFDVRDNVTAMWLVLLAAPLIPMVRTGTNIVLIIPKEAG